ncbi:MAG: hypothetical protein J2P35_09420 [Actinobacteria bacterium]|nr:hypothetical protein [Actinomycetota bacterium]MBO0786159.1 hypothetical protein [Actinomycetota bacterium]
MTIDPGQLAHARKVADAVLYEGYLLYPYRQSSQKNQVRFQFGVLMPPAFAAADSSERSASRTECLAEPRGAAEVDITVRFLRLRRRLVQAVTPDGGLRETDRLEVDGTEFSSWDEADECEHRFRVPLADLLGAGLQREFRSGSAETAEELTDAQGRVAGRLLRLRAAVDLAVRASAELLPGPYGAVRLQVRAENRTSPPAPPGTRDEALRHAMLAVHLLIGIDGGTFLSLTDPPEWAAPAAAACVNEGTWPVLAGPPECRNLLLSAPVILPDHPEIAPESAGDLFDATEIDEILTLRTLALTDTEKAEARATDPRAAQLMDRLDEMPPELMDKLHGAIRYLETAGGKTGEPAGAEATPGPAVPWWDPGADSSVSPETDHVLIGGVRVARGSRVRMQPGSRRADAQDLFLAGRDAVVEAVLHDVDGQVHVAVSPASDPVAELQRSHGRFLYFAPDEIEPVGTNQEETP